MRPSAVLLDANLRAFEARAQPYGLIRIMSEHSGDHPLNYPHTISDMQLLRLRRMVRYAEARSPYYRELFARLGIRPRDIRSLDDYRRLPFTSAHDLNDWQRFIAVPEEHLSAVFTTSGTTGEPKRLYYTTHELNALHNIGALGLRLRLHGRLRALIALPAGLWIGSNEACAIVERAGGLALPVGIADPAVIVGQMRRFEPNIMITSPSFMVILTHEAQRQRFRAELQAILVSGETLLDEQKELFLDYWHAPTYNSYGTTEIGGGQTLALPNSDCLYLNGLQLYTEIIDPATGLPAEAGELVYTPLVREAMPLLRYRSGDLAKWCKRGNWLPFGSIILDGRDDDLILAADMNLYAHILADAAGRAAGASGRVAITVDKVNLVDRLRLRVEGNGVREDDVRSRLYAAYPELRQGVGSASLLLEIEADAQLGEQLKAVKLTDLRRSGKSGGQRAGALVPPAA